MTSGHELGNGGVTLGHELGNGGVTSGHERAAAIAKAVVEVRGVAGLDSGTVGQVATFGPGERVAGVRVTKEQVLVRVTIAQGMRVADVDSAIRNHLDSLVSDMPLNIQIADIVTSAE